MKKRYEPKQIEKKWQRYWEEKDYFSPSLDREKAAFSMVMPPANITGALHIGHALNNTIQDIMARFKRMQGYDVFWVPGIDHAGIATQNVVERSLAREGLSRQQLGKEEFCRRIWKWKEKYGEKIFSQLKDLGVSCSWKDRTFTMDEKYRLAVKEVFVRLYEEGYIYRGSYIINWCPKCRTALSDIEVKYEEAKGKLYYIRYPFKDEKLYLVVATTRPETMLGDTAVAVNPEDKRYKGLQGKRLILPLVGRELPLIYDRYVDPEFGTGAVKITPAHDPNDFLIGKKYDLPFINILTKDGRINENGGAYRGLDRYECRRKILEDLEEEGYLEKVEDYVHRLGRCYRCETPVEPYISTQWFIRMKDLARQAIEVVKRGKIKFFPSFWEKIYFQWMENIRDWCISRQIWWGHQIPVWYCKSCGKVTVTRQEPDRCSHCGSSHLKQDEDVLDTWFSSSLWPFSSLGWPEKSEKLERFYPTSLLCTSWDILFFWVARMIMMGIKFTGKVPFHKVYIHPLIGDEKGEKMSKSKGNVIDPLEMMRKYGTDAFRFSLVAFKTDSRYIRFSEERVRGYRNFVNKIWNASRFILMNIEDLDPGKSLKDLKMLELCDRWIISRYHHLLREVTSNLESFKFSEAANLLYQFIWDELCDWYIELVKPRLRKEEDPSSRYSAQWILLYVLKGTLKMLHPFMPFITEEIYQRLSKDGDEESIMISSWPRPEGERDREAEEKMSLLMKVIQEARTIRSEMRIPPQKKINLYLKSADPDELELLEKNKSYISHLVKTEQLIIGEEVERPADSASSVVEKIELFIPLKGLLDLDKEKKRLKAMLKELEERLNATKKRLSNPQFLKNAPSQVVNKEKEKELDLGVKVERLKKRLEEIE